MPFTLSAEKTAAAREFAAALPAGARLCLTTHVNPDGDGLGSEAGLAHLLRGAGFTVAVANPNATPPRFRFLFEGLEGVDRSAAAVKEVRRADAILVLDISDLGRLGVLGEAVRTRGVPVLCVDHHVGGGDLPPGPRYVDPTAAATGELVWELARANGWPVTREAARALYVAILTDTGGFRFSNTHPRTLRIAAELLETGIDPERIYLDVYANAPEGRVRLLAEALDTLVVEPGPGLAWLTVPPGALERHGVTADDLDGVIEHARSIAGVRLALLFRELAGGRIKVSLRSVGDVDVASFARRYGGGGHTKAAGVAFAGTMAEVQAALLADARAWLGAGVAPAVAG
ncbi:MAG TPA: bifunctional oligoribonuclease/PAP phosphatase NrnA [Gemmatimonadales bacterium]|nr:bifunctional oligoribonuclease/PAP phosphatase NrnA [Gemmatimonadales bacterium]